MTDILLQKFFEKERWEQALEVGVGKGIDKVDRIGTATRQNEMTDDNAAQKNAFIRIKSSISHLADHLTNRTGCYGIIIGRGGISRRNGRRKILQTPSVQH